MNFMRASTEKWTQLNPILEDGQPGFERLAQTDTSGEPYYKLKVGDGHTRWNDLPYVSGSGGEEGDEVGRIDRTPDAQYHGEIFNTYEGIDINKAINLYAHAEGSRTVASGYAAHAEGYASTASSYQTHAEGYNTTASGLQAHSEGNTTTASGDYSHAEGYNTTASESSSHAEGNDTTASGESSHTEGDSTTASGDYSHAEGYHSETTGMNAHAEGMYTVASAENTHAEGYYTIANGENQHVSGKYNVSDNNDQYAVIVGGGDNFNRKNIFTLDWNGNINCGTTDAQGNWVTHGLINGVDVTSLSPGPSNVLYSDTNGVNIPRNEDTMTFSFDELDALKEIISGILEAYDIYCTNLGMITFFDGDTVNLTFNITLVNNIDPGGEIPDLTQYTGFCTFTSRDDETRTSSYNLTFVSREEDTFTYNVSLSSMDTAIRIGCGSHLIKLIFNDGIEDITVGKGKVLVFSIQ